MIDGSWDIRQHGSWPTEVHLYFTLVAYNVGARSGILTQFWLDDFSEVPGGEQVFRFQSHGLESPQHRFEAGTLRSYFNHPLLETAVENGDIDSLRARLQGKKEVKVRVGIVI